MDTLIINTAESFLCRSAKNMRIIFSFDGYIKLYTQLRHSI